MAKDDKVRRRYSSSIGRFSWMISPHKSATRVLLGFLHRLLFRPPTYTGEEVFNLCYTRRHGLHWNNQRGNFNLHYTTIHRGMQICFRELALFHTTLVYRKSSSVASSPTILFLNTFVTRRCVIALPRKPTDIVYVLLPQRKPRDWQR